MLREKSSIKALKVLGQAGIMFASVTTLSFPSLAHVAAHITTQHKTTKKVCQGFLPENNRQISEFDKSGGGLTREQFDSVINRVQNVYAPIIQKMGATLIVQRLWSDTDYAKDFDGTVMTSGGKPMSGATLNAFATRSDDHKKFAVYMFGGLARHPSVTEDGFAMVICHEIGHHLGGFPRKINTTGKMSWAANEGQADYFATMKCMRKVFENDTSMPEMPSDARIVKAIQDQCSVEHKSSDEINLCIRDTVAGQSLAELFADLLNSTAPRVDTPTKMEVSKTSDAHPDAQCRLDTYFAGAVCGVSDQINFSQTGPVQGACAEEGSRTFGARPRCWYKPALLF